MNHELARDETADSIIGDCSCGRWFIESQGRDATSKASVVRQFETHVEAVAA